MLHWFIGERPISAAGMGGTKVRTAMEIMDHLTLSFQFPNNMHVNFEANQMRRGTPAPRPVYEELRNLKVPVLLLWGAHDSGVALERSLLLFQAMPGAELHIFERAAHWVQWDQRDRFNTIVRDFMLA